MYRTLVLLALVGALAAEEPCTCDQVTNDVDDLRQFLRNPEKYSPNSVLPGELSPYVCTCNQYRQRRSEAQHPKVVGDAVPFFSSKTAQTVKGCSERKQELGRYRCASGFIRRGIFCIKDPCSSDNS